MTITHLRHVGIFSPDLGKHREFYRAIWGLDQIDEEIDAVYFRGASAEHHLLSLHAAKRCGLHHIAFGVSNEDDVRRTARELQSRGIRLVSEPQPLGEPGGGYGFRFFDPEGRCIELSAGVIQHQGGWQAKPVQPHSICHVVLNTTRMDDMIGFTQIYSAFGSPTGAKIRWSFCDVIPNTMRLRLVAPLTLLLTISLTSYPMSMKSCAAW